MIESIRTLLDTLAVSFDLPILDWIAANLWCPLLDTLMPIITVLGDAGIFWIAIAVLFLFTKKYRKIGLGMVFALIMGLLVCNIYLKPTIGRIRPYDFQEEYLGVIVNLLIEKRRPAAAPMFEKKAAMWLLIVLFAAGGVGVALNNQINLYLSGVIPSAVFFPIVNGGGLILITLASLVFFKERLTGRQWIGLGLGIAATLLLCI